MARTLNSSWFNRDFQTPFARRANPSWPDASRRWRPARCAAPAEGAARDPPAEPARAVEFPEIASWSDTASAADQERALDILERGGVVVLPNLGFRLSNSEHRFLAPSILADASKMISFDFEAGVVRGSRLGGDDLCDLAAMMWRYNRAACGLVEALLPRYRRYVCVGRASFRPMNIADRAASGHRGDRRLHIDADRCRPSGGRRILRVFTNVDAEGRPRLWRVGEPFAIFAARHLPGVRRMFPGEAWLLETLRITRGRRTPYDHLMLVLHDRATADGEDQTNARSAVLSFPPDTSWIAFADQVPHAALGGQYALEQTFLVYPAGLRTAARSPLAALEELTGRALL